MKGLRVPGLLLACCWLMGCETLTQAPPINPPVTPPPPAQVSCPEAEPCVCPVPETIEVAVPVPVVEPCREDHTSLPVLGGVEWVSLDADGVIAKARIDTGAKTSSINADKLQEFERDGKPWLRFNFEPGGQGQPVKLERPIERRVRIKRNDGTSHRRYVVKILLAVGDISENVEVSLNDRSDFDYPVLIGRNFLTDNALVDVSRKMLAKKPGDKDSDTREQ